MDATPKSPIKNTKQIDSDSTIENKSNMLYMSIDHLKKGTYSLNILEKEKVIKLIKIKKQ